MPKIISEFGREKAENDGHPGDDPPGNRSRFDEEIQDSKESGEDTEDKAASESNSNFCLIRSVFAHS